MINRLVTCQCGLKVITQEHAVSYSTTASQTQQQLYKEYQTSAYIFNVQIYVMHFIHWCQQSQTKLPATHRKLAIITKTQKFKQLNHISTNKYYKSNYCE